MEQQVSLYKNSSSKVTDAFDNVVANICLQREKKGYKSYLLTGVEPGVGTTTVAIELAMALAETGWKTLLLDADMRKNSAYKRLGENLFVGMTDYIRGSVDETKIIYGTNIENLDYVPCGNVKDSNQLRMLYSHRMSKILNILNACYDYVIIDVPALNSAVDPHIFAMKTDATIIVAALDGSSKKMLEEARDKLVKDGANIIGVIENKVTMEAYKDYKKDFDYFTEKKYLHGNHLSFGNKQ